MSVGAVIALLVVLTACGGGGTRERDTVATPDARLRAAITVDRLAAHLRALQRFADLGEGSRAEGSPGFRGSVDYVQEQLRPTGYRVTLQPFAFKAWRELRPTVFELVQPAPRSLDSGDFSTWPGSRTADVTARVQATTDVVLAPDERDTSTSGCEATDFTGFVPGNVALVQRGSCDFRRKIENAQAAGAAAVVIFNEGHAEGRDVLHFQAIERPDVVAPVLFVSYDLGVDLYRAATSVRPLRAHIATRTGIAKVESVNVVAASPRGRHDRTIVIGAHLDSALAGPGLNDNGSGSAVLLELAQRLPVVASHPRNRVVFAWWGGEESGLKGSEHFVSKLSGTELKGVRAYINLDMLGSPNFGRLVDDGDGSATYRPGPAGSAAIERVFLDYFKARALRVSAPGPDMRGRSDLQVFADREIPVGGLLTGAGEPKPAWQVDLFGGRPEVAYDPCYHEPCDRYPENVNMRVLEQMADAAAHAVLRLATRGLPAP